MSYYFGMYEDERLYTEQMDHEDEERYVDERTLEMMMMDEPQQEQCTTVHFAAPRPSRKSFVFNDLRHHMTHVLCHVLPKLDGWDLARYLHEQTVCQKKKKKNFRGGLTSADDYGIMGA